MAKFKINKNVNNAIKREVEAHHYTVVEGFFHFYEGEASGSAKVFTIASSAVSTIEAERE